eukprot:8248041-Ditylum_brightwellii.AAC.1
MQGCGNKAGNDGDFMNKPISFVLFSILNHMKEEDSGGDDESISDDKITDIKDGLYVFYHATTAMSLKEMFPQCKQFANLIILCWDVWECVNIYLVANLVSYPHYVRLGLRVMWEVEKRKVKDWKKVKRNEDDWSLASMCRRLVPSSSIDLASDVSLTEKYKMMVKADVVELGKKPITVVEHCTQEDAIGAFIKQLGRMQGSGVRDELIACHYLFAFWEKAATAKIIHDGHLTIYKLLASSKEYLTMNVYNDLMMLNKLELELLTN